MARLRIISAGSFHNLVLYAVLCIPLWSSMERFMWNVVGYTDVGHYGKVVIAVDQVLMAACPLLLPQD